MGNGNSEIIYFLVGFPHSLVGKERVRLQCRRPQFNSWVRKIPWRRERLPTPVFLGFPYGSAGKECACSVGDLGSIPGLGRSPTEGKGYPLQYSGLENSIQSMDLQRVRYDWVTFTLFSWTPKSIWTMTAAWNWKTLASWRESYDKPKQCNKKHRHYFANKGPSSQRYGFSSGHVWMWELDSKKGRVPKNWCFWSVVLEKTLESPLDCKEIKPVNPKGNQSWKFIGRTDAKAKTWILWPPDVKSWLTGKDPDVGKDWGQERETTEDEMVGWHQWLNGHEFEQTQGNG